MEKHGIKECYISIPKHLPAVSRAWLDKPRKVIERRGTVASSRVRFVDDEVRDIASDNFHPVPIDYIPIIKRAQKQDELRHAEVCPEHLRTYLKFGSMSKKGKNTTCNLAIAGSSKQNDDTTSDAVECIDGNEQVDGGVVTDLDVAIENIGVIKDTASVAVECIDGNEQVDGGIVSDFGEAIDNIGVINDLVANLSIDVLSNQIDVTASVDVRLAGAIENESSGSIVKSVANLSIGGPQNDSSLNVESPNGTIQTDSIENTTDGASGDSNIIEDGKNDGLNAVQGIDDNQVVISAGTPECLEEKQEYCPFSRSRNPPFARGGRRQSIAVMPTIPESNII